MYEHLRGCLTSKNPAQAVLDVGGIGFRTLIPLSTFERLPAVGVEVLLHTTFVVRDDSQRLYGFATPDERAFFELLLGVNGVGPAVALGIVSAIPPEAFGDAVREGDAARLRRVKGVGKRLSERLVVELRDSVGDFVAPGRAPAADDVGARDAILALEALGFTRAAARKALATLRQDAPDLDEPGELVRRALQLI